MSTAEPVKPLSITPSNETCTESSSTTRSDGLKISANKVIFSTSEGKEYNQEKLKGRVNHQTLESEKVLVTITTLKSDITSDKLLTDSEIKKNEQMISNLKTKKVAFTVLIGIGLLVLTLGVGLACVFCPPAGVALLVVGIVIIGSFAIGIGTYNLRQEPESEMKEKGKLDKKSEDLNKALKLFNQTIPRNELSYEQFLQTCPTFDNHGLPIYRLQDLDKYNALYEKHLRINALEKKLATKKTKIKENADLDTLSRKHGLNKSDDESFYYSLMKKLQNKSEILEKNKRALHINGAEEEQEEEITENIKENHRLLEIFKGFDLLYTEKEKLVQESKALLTYIERDTKSHKTVSNPNLSANPPLKLWTQKNFYPTKQTTVDRNQKDGPIFLFGMYCKAPSHGIFDGRTHGGVYLKGLPLEGRRHKNNFLSNSYVNDLEIEGTTYKSVTHYMWLKTIDRRLNSLPLQDPKKALQEKALLEEMKEKIETLETVKELNIFLAQPQYTHLINPFYPNSLKFEDNDLKEALYHKFVSQDGKLTEEGILLRDTLNKKLYAGYEEGHPSWGMQFDSDKLMIGDNKLGVFLMELREIIKDFDT